MGQCNDAYSAVVVASKLAEVFGTDINGLPLSLDLSWLEQKAVIILLSLLHLNVKNIRIGPRAPAFLTPEALKVWGRRVAGREGSLPCTQHGSALGWHPRPVPSARAACPRSPCAGHCGQVELADCGHQEPRERRAEDDGGAVSAPPFSSRRRGEHADESASLRVSASQPALFCFLFSVCRRYDFQPTPS